MKKVFVTLTVLFIILLTGCGNRSIIDTTYTFTDAQIQLPSGDVVEGKIKRWSDYSDGDQLQITFEDDTTYLVHSSQAVLSVKK